MPRPKPFRSLFVLVAILALVVAGAGLRAADTLPAQFADEAFWKFIDASSEFGGDFHSENFTSNETGFQTVIPSLKQTVKPDGVYLGVGPEQNFTYISALRPKMAFIVDIRRQNMLEHLLYKSAFELSADRADFLSRLFSRKRPAGLSEKSTVSELFRAYQPGAFDAGLFAKNLREVRDLLIDKHKFGLTNEDRRNIEHVYRVFAEAGPDINYNSSESAQPGRSGSMPNYAELMVAADSTGKQWGYLASEENYKFLRDLENRNMLVPLSGDFGGPKALRAVAKYIKDHNAILSAFYLSNVEQYLFQGEDRAGHLNGGGVNFYKNVEQFPLDASSTFIRSGLGLRIGNGMRSSVTASIQETLAAVKDGRIKTYNDVFTISR